MDAVGKAAANAIVTRASLAHDAAALGVESGNCVCVHVRMSALGLVIGGPRAILDGLLDAVGGAGTIMMPAYSGDLSDPAEWRHPAVPAHRLDEIRDAIPAFDPIRTPTRGMGTVAEYFRTYPGVRRSPHPQSSFVAFGSSAEFLTKEHSFDYRFGPTSPLGRLVEMKGKVLLLGAPYDTISLFHLTQHLIGNSRQVRKSAPVIECGIRRWVEYADLEYPVDWFEDGVRFLIDEGIAVTGEIGMAHSVLVDAQRAVDRLIGWRQTHGLAGVND
jgi:aminoglycoside 3-N-acetyltransferase